MRPLVFHFDFISPYAYLAWKGIQALADRHGREVEARPVLLAGLLNATGGKGPAEVEPKRIYTYKHVARLAHAAGVPMRPPPAHPFNPLVALRVAGLPRAAPDTRRLIDALYDATWASGAGIDSPEAVGRVLASLGLDPIATLEEAASSEAKDRIRRFTDELLAAGGFGVPSTLADGELFWGYDAFPQIEAFLRGEDPVDPRELARWRDIPASARRIPQP